MRFSHWSLQSLLRSWYSLLFRHSAISWPISAIRTASCSSPFCSLTDINRIQASGVLWCESLLEDDCSDPLKSVFFSKMILLLLNVHRWVLSPFCREAEKGPDSPYLLRGDGCRVWCNPRRTGDRKLRIEMGVSCSSIVKRGFWCNGVTSGDTSRSDSTKDFDSSSNFERKSRLAGSMLVARFVLFGSILRLESFRYVLCLSGGY